MLIKSSKKVAPKFCCNLCYYTTSKKSNYAKHLLTSKHQNVNNATGMLIESCSKLVSNKINICFCGKEYKHLASLCRHKKICNHNQYETTDVSCHPKNADFIVELLKQNNEFKSLLSEQNKFMVEQNKYMVEQMTDQNKHMAEQNKHMIKLMETGIGNTTNSHNTTNNKFNLNFFLNEQCKDAMNITEFVNSLQLQLSDLEKVGELGYAQGISNIFINGLKQLDIFKRPIHCSDVKRETMYIKDKDAWEKENQEREKMMWAIKNIAHKNIKQIPEWQQENPEYKDSESETNGKFLKIVSESMGGYTDQEDSANYNKIIRNVAKEVSIDRV